MAGDWIKMRADLSTHPKVVRMMSALKADRLRIIGGLHAVWCLFDMHSEDGILEGYTVEALDDLIGFPGFSSSLESIGWLESSGDHLALPRFEEHNGQSAKRRAQEAERKRIGRNLSASDADKIKTKCGPEKRREEKSIRKPKPSPAADTKFDEFWSRYPRKEAKATAKKAFAKIGPDDALFVLIIAGLERAKKSEQWTKDDGQFVPHPTTWLNGARWDDVVVVPAAVEQAWNTGGYSDLLAKSRELGLEFIENEPGPALK